MFLGINVSWYIKEFLFVFFVCIHVILVPTARKDPLACACENLSWIVLSLFICLSDRCHGSHAGFWFFLCTCIALSFILLSACGFEGLRYAIIAMYSAVFICMYCIVWDALYKNDSWQCQYSLFRKYTACGLNSRACAMPSFNIYITVNATSRMASYQTNVQIDHGCGRMTTYLVNNTIHHIISTLFYSSSSFFFTCSFKNLGYLAC